MKRFNVSKVLGASALAVSLATLPAVLPASAQTNTTTTDSTVNNTTERGLTDGNYQDGDWGLLGLLGLFGLFGRKSSRRNNDAVAYNDPDVASTSSRTRY